MVMARKLSGETWIWRLRHQRNFDQVDSVHSFKSLWLAREPA
jgi:hypothetical protein